MNKKKMKICLILVLVLIECISLTLTIKSFNNRNLEEIKEEHKVNNKKFSMYIKNESGAYVPYNDTNLFPEGYALNLEKSSCVDTNGKKLENVLVNNGDSITITSNKTVYCYLYLDLITDDVTISIKTDGKSGVMPSSGTYTNSASCNSGSITWSDKYQRIEIGNLTKQAICNLTFTKDTSSKNLLKTKVEEVNVNNNYNSHGYRYSGKTPDNYIWFNNEMWRIIGSIPICLTASCGTNTTNLVKIIRDESIGSLSVDGASSYTAVWENTKLYTLLNSYYYGMQNATGTSYCNGYQNAAALICDYTGKGINADSYYGKMIKNVYWNTGAGSSQVASDSYTKEIAIRTVSGYVGLMGRSDYGYAAASGYHSTDLGSYYTAEITGTNWLYNQSGEWTLSRYSNGDVYYISDSGGSGGVSGAYDIFNVRPVVYLDSSVFIIEGNGSITNPYIVGM